MPSATITRTLVLPLETSGRKNERVRSAIDEWQRIASRMTDLMPSLGPDHWRTQDTTVFHAVQDEFPDCDLRMHDAYQAGYKVAEKWGSWESNGRPGDPPSVANGDYARFCGCCAFEFERNDSGFGVKVRLQPYDGEWFRVAATGEWVVEQLDAVVDGALDAGSGELHLRSDGSLDLHISVSEDVAVPEWDDVETVVGVDVGEDPMWTTAAVGAGGILDVRIESGAEFRHYRERLKRKQRQWREEGDLRRVRSASAQYRDYTDHVTHAASRSIVEFARQWDDSGIVLEDLTHIRDRSATPIHDWPFDELQTKISYKAAAEGIAVSTISPEGTTISCRQCGHAEEGNVAGGEFACLECGYRVHAKVNAAANIAGRQSSG